jgi:cytochrome c peroxidase
MKTPATPLGSCARPRLLASLPLLLAALVAAASADPGSRAATPESLGRLLFWDPVLSGPKDVACATCPHPDFAWADGRDLARGTGSLGLGPAREDHSGGTIPVVPRNAPTILNVAFNGLDGRRGRRAVPDASLAANRLSAPMFWDNRVRGLGAQALEPLKALEEMRGHTYAEDAAVDSVVARLRAIPEYVDLFQQAFGPGEAITPERIGRAIASFERTLVAMNSPFDRFRAGDSTALTAQQRRGMREFDAAGCDRCHEGVMFSDFDLHAEGVAEHPLLAQPDAGGGRFRFRTPSLRNVALTAPYMHNGTLATLEDVLRFYDAGRSENPNVATGNEQNARRGRNGPGGGNDAAASSLARLDGDFRRVRNMSERDMADIVAFLGALTDPGFDRSVPERVPSGLPPGGAIAAR